MNRSIVPALAALTFLTVACGSDGAAPGDTLPDPDIQTTEVPVTTPVTAPVTEVPITEPPATDDAQSRLDAAAARWNDHGPASYTMVTRQLCFCPEQEWQDTVVDGEVAEHITLSDDSFFDPGPATMPSLFADIQAVIDEGYASLDLAFDSETGAVQRYFVDIDERMADEEHGVEVVSIEELAVTTTDG
jgi:hypothetical protein